MLKYLILPALDENHSHIRDAEALTALEQPSATFQPQKPEIFSRKQTGTHFRTKDKTGGGTQPQNYAEFPPQTGHSPVWFWLA